MDKNAIINDIKANNGAEIAVLQQKFNISYKEAKIVIDELVAKGTLVFESGLKYSYAKNRISRLRMVELSLNVVEPKLFVKCMKTFPMMVKEMTMPRKRQQPNAEHISKHVDKN